MTGKRVDLAALADEPRLADARVPRFATQGQAPVPVDQVAPNPLNTRIIDPSSPKITEIRNSIEMRGQLQSCTVVHRKAFLAIFSEYESAIGVAPFVQVTGGRRRVALQQLGKPIDISIKDELAASREEFVGATAAENFDREDYDAMEEAFAVQLMVKEAGSTAAAASRLNRTKTWVIQRTNLLKLEPKVQQMIREAKVPLRDVRSLHTHPSGKQVAVLRALLAQKKADDDADPTDNEDQPGPVPRPRATAAASAVRRLGGTPPKIAESLRSVLSPEELHTLSDLLRQ